MFKVKVNLIIIAYQLASVGLIGQAHAYRYTQNRFGRSLLVHFGAEFHLADKLLIPRSHSGFPLWLDDHLYQSPSRVILIQIEFINAKLVFKSSVIILRVKTSTQIHSIE